jgi:hypothetical protein
VGELAPLGLVAVQIQSSLTGVLARDADAYPTDEGGR